MLRPGSRRHHQAGSRHAERVDDRIGVSPQETLYVGDMVLDAETARNAGVQLALVATGGNTYVELEAANPDFLFHDITGLLSF